VTLNKEIMTIELCWPQLLEVLLSFLNIKNNYTVQSTGFRPRDLSKNASSNNARSVVKHA